MSLILKGIDLPRNGDCHHITIYDNGDTYMTTSNILYETDRKDVEAIQIPTPHGRLIDIEKLKEEFAMKNNICKECDSFKECDNKTYSKTEICEKFIWVPTILEAEE